MIFLIDLFSLVAVSAGFFFYLAGTVGLLRFPDSLCRVHALTKADNLGLGLVVLGVLPQLSDFWVGLKLVLVWLFLLFSASITAQLVGQLARMGEPRTKEPSGE